jgi:hypothetical protein
MQDAFRLLSRSSRKKKKERNMPHLGPQTGDFRETYGRAYPEFPTVVPLLLLTKILNQKFATIRRWRCVWRPIII